MSGESKKTLWIIGAVVVAVILVLGSIGVLYIFRNQPSGGGEQIIDSDGDGYADSEDDFPHDSNLHKKTVLVDIKGESIPYAQHYSTHNIQVSSSIKYLEWSWRLVQSPTSTTLRMDATIHFWIERKTTSGFIKLVDKQAYADSGRLVVDYSNVGDWGIYWLNFPYPDKGWGTLYLEAYVYIVE